MTPGPQTAGTAPQPQPAASSPFAMALAQYDRAVRHLSLKRGIDEFLRHRGASWP